MNETARTNFLSERLTLMLGLFSYRKSSSSPSCSTPGFSRVELSAQAFRDNNSNETS